MTDNPRRQPAIDELTKRRIRLVVTVVALVLLVPGLTLLYLYNPEEVSFFPPCMSKLITHYDCPGCGTTRALHNLLHGNIAAAWHYNRFLFVAVPFVIFLAAGMYSRPGSRLRRASEWRWLAPLTLVVVVAWWVLRNVFQV